MSPIELILITLINAIFFFTLTIRNVLKPSKQKYIEIYSAEMAVTALVFFQYFTTFILDNSNVLHKDYELFAHQLKYADWVITTPLLLYTFWKFANIEGYTDSFTGLFWASIVMTFCAIIGEFTSPRLLIIAFIAFGVILFEIGEIMNFFWKNDKHQLANLGWFFIVGWWIYPFAFFFQGATRYFIFGIADFINKGLFSVALNAFI